jgi:hypothetical protein
MSTPATDPTAAGTGISEPGSYSFGPRETRGLLLGLRGAQLITLACGLGCLVAGVSAGLPGAALGAFATAASIAAVFTPVGGRTAEQWLPVAAGFGLQRLTGQHRYRRPLTGVDEPALPGPLAGLRILSVPVDDDHAVAVVKDPGRGTYTAVAGVRGSTFALLETGDQQRRVATWGRLLAELARDGSPVGSVQWVARAVPDSGDALARFWAEAGGHGSRAAAASYRQLIAGAAPVTQRHETYLAVGLDVRRARRAIRQAGGGDAGACTVLLRELTAIQDRLAQASLDLVGWLPPRALGQVLRGAYEPGAQQHLDQREGHGPGAGVDPAVVGPMAAETGWGDYRSDDGWHATYWVHEWPRLPVSADFLAPLLLETSCRRTVAVHAEPVSSRRAAQQAAAARTAELANQAMRDRVGQLTTERHRAEAAEVARREAELVAGHAEFRFTGFITVTATSRAELDEACGQVEHAAHQSYLEIRRLYGEQDQAFTYTLPLARGPR